MQKHLLTTKEAAEFLTLSEAFLEKDRWSGPKISFIKVGSRAVRYRLEDLEAYLKKQIIKSVDSSEKNLLQVTSQ